MVSQYDVCLTRLGRTKGSEIRKTRPCVVISPDEMNQHLSTVIVAPLTTKFHNFPMRVKLTFNEKVGWVMLDQIRAIDRKRVIKNLGKMNVSTVNKIKQGIKEMLVD